MINGFIDSHFHFLELQKKTSSAITLLQNAFLNGMKAALDIGTDHYKIEERLSLSNEFPHLFFSFGFSPLWVTQPEWEKTAEDMIGKWKNDSRIVALGETGIDLHWNYGTLEDQIKLFRMHLTASNETKKPVIIHSRNADSQMLNILSKYDKKISGVLHCFCSDKKTVLPLIERGLFISFAGNITFKNAENIREAIKVVPLNRLLLETDAPYLAPTPHRGKPNHPELITHTYTIAAELLGIPVNNLIKQTIINFNALFLKYSTNKISL